MSTSPRGSATRRTTWSVMSVVNPDAFFGHAIHEPPSGKIDRPRVSISRRCDFARVANTTTMSADARAGRRTRTAGGVSNEKPSGARSITNVELGLIPNFVARGLLVGATTRTFCHRRATRSRLAAPGSRRCSQARTRGTRGSSDEVVVGGWEVAIGDRVTRESASLEGVPTT